MSFPRHDWIGKVIQWGLCKKFKLDNNTKRYMHKPESSLENETHKVLWDIEPQTNKPIPVRRPNLEITNQKIQ